MGLLVLVQVVVFGIMMGAAAAEAQEITPAPDAIQSVESIKVQDGDSVVSFSTDSTAIKQTIETSVENEVSEPSVEGITGSAENEKGQDASIQVANSISMSDYSNVDFADEESECDGEDAVQEDEKFLSHSGFLDARIGGRIYTAEDNKKLSLAEVRLRTSLQKEYTHANLKLTFDVIIDPIEDADTVDLYQGNGTLDLREAYVGTSLGSFDFRFGRQAMTWGTGDMIFINDLFPKDWKSFFIGRDMEFLKAPLDAVKVSYFHSLFSIDLLWTPLFASDRYIDGSRISYFSPMFGKAVGKKTEFDAEARDEFIKDSEYSIRVSSTIRGVTAALYGYYGFWKSPAGMTQMGVPYYPELLVYGGSVQSPLLGGIAKAEFGHYHSREDVGGLNPFIPNPELRFLTGYEHEIIANLTGSVQYYVEYMLEYDNYRKTLFQGMNPKEEYRDMVTARLTYMMLQQTLVHSLFGYYSPAENDGYVKMSSSYKVTDALAIDAGANIFMGEEDYTFWGQFESNSNVYGGLRYSF